MAFYFMGDFSWVGGGNIPQNGYKPSQNRTYEKLHFKGEPHRLCVKIFRYRQTHTQILLLFLRIEYIPRFFFSGSMRIDSDSDPVSEFIVHCKANHINNSLL